MSFFTSFIKAATKEELLLLRNNLKLKGKERAVFDYLTKSGSEPTKRDALKFLNISSSHFDKINNILLQKSYKIVCGEENILYYLNQKQLINHLIHEIKIKEKKINPDTAKNYFDFIVGVPARSYKESEAVKLGEKLIKNSDDKANASIYVRCRLLYAKMNVIRHGKPSKERLQKLLIEIENLKSVSAHTFEPETRLWIYKTLAFFYIRIDKNFVLHFDYLEKIKNLFEENNNLPLKEKAINDCNIASHYYDTNNLLRAQRLYKEAFVKYSHLLVSEVRHVARFVEINIILNDLTLAEVVYRKWLKIFLKTENEAFGVLASITYAKLLIYNKKYREALKTIQLGKFLNSRLIYYKYDIELRMLENIIFALRKDYHFALDLAHKNLKYISSQGLSLKKFMHALFFKLIIYLLNHRLEGVPVSTRVINYFKKYKQGELLIYGQLLNRLN